MAGRLTLILGGARSGKSDFAQALARKRGGADVIFLATAQARDDEMRTRIAVHRAARPERWTTLETPRAVARTLQSAPRVSVVILDCVTLWVSNVLLANERTAEQEMLSEVNELIEWQRESGAELIVVSNEVGMGVVPPYELGRAYRDLLGIVNRRIAAAADQVFLLVVGLPIELKALTRGLQDV